MINPNKYQNLLIAKDNNINIPDFLYLSKEQIELDNLEEVVTSFLKKFNKNQLFIIRSAVSIEDSNNESYAGFFYSSKEIKYESVFKNIINAYNKNNEIKLKQNLNCIVNLIVQIFITSEIGGVIFTPWKYYHNHFLVEFSSSGPSMVVSGEDSSFFILSKDNFTSLNDIPESLRKISHELIKNVTKLHTIFEFAMDIEWGYFNNKIYIFQIRPITSQPSALELAPQKQKSNMIGKLNLKAKGSWTYSSLSESLGVISPLTFSLFETLFKKTSFYYKKIGFEAKKFNFLAHMPNGSVAVNIDEEKQFFKSHSFFSPFFRTLYNNKLSFKITNYLNSLEECTNEYSFEKICKIFNYWQIANIYVYIFNKKTYKNSTIGLNEYELLNYDNMITFPEKTLNNWADIKNKAKRHFLFEINKIKQKIYKDPILVFANWEDYHTNSIDKEKLVRSYLKYIKNSKYYYPLDHNMYSKQNQICISGTNDVIGKTLIIENPLLFNREFQNKDILIAPYFKNDWLVQIHKLSGIILENGGYLSHSAIVAREKNIPYYIKVDKAISIYKNKTIKLVPKKNLIHILN